MNTYDDPILYRIIDFFEVISLAKCGELRVPSAFRFPDKNELLGIFLSTLDSPSFHPYTEDAMAKMISEHQLHKQAHFISSWTQSRDSIAMWELYSLSKDSIQIGVRRSQIEDAFDIHSKKHSYNNGHEAKPDDGCILFYPSMTGPCEYVKFSEMLEKLKNRFDNFYRKADAKSYDSDEFLKAYREFSETCSIDFKKAPFFKDDAYLHEKEYRFVLHGVTRNHHPYEKCKEDMLFLLSDTHLRPVRQEDVGENIFIPFDIGVIEEVWMDG